MISQVAIFHSCLSSNVSCLRHDHLLSCLDDSHVAGISLGYSSFLLKCWLLPKFPFLENHLLILHILIILIYWCFNYKLYVDHSIFLMSPCSIKDLKTTWTLYILASLVYHLSSMVLCEASQLLVIWQMISLPFSSFNTLTHALKIVSYELSYICRVVFCIFLCFDILEYLTGLNDILHVWGQCQMFSNKKQDSIK